MTQRFYSIVAWVLLGVLGAFMLAFIINPASTHANPLSFNRKQSAAATSTLSTVTTAATSTLAFDTAPGVAMGANDAVLLLQHTGSSTASVINVSFQYSQGGPTGANCETTQSACDWYDDNTVDLNATSTLVITPTPANRWVFTYASSTMYGAGDARNTHMINVPQHTRYVRAVITAVGAANSQVWYEFVNRKEVQ